jgi:hypothetical protein
MSRSFFQLLAVALFALSGCATGMDPNLFVAVSGDRRESTFVPQGYGWVKGSRIEILVLAEPQVSDNEITASGSWRSLGFVTADPIGMFGFNSGAFRSVVRRICGFPPEWMAQPLFLARDANTGTFKFYSGNKVDWFSFAPCP